MSGGRVVISNEFVPRYWIQVTGLLDHSNQSWCWEERLDIDGPERDVPRTCLQRIGQEMLCP